MTKQKLRALPLAVLVACWTVGSVLLGPVMIVKAAEADSAGIFGDHADVDGDVEGQEITVGSFGQVDLHVKELEVSQVLQLLSLQSQRNIIASRNVAGSISADLYGVDFYEALDAILHTNGFGYEEKGNLIFVYTTAELEAIKESQRKVTHRIYRLNYITAADASAFVTPLLSEAGSLSVSADVGAGFQPSIGDGGANSYAHTDTIIIHDYAEHVDEIVAVLQELDKRPKQVLVEATILQASLTENNAFGVDLSVLADFAVSRFLDPLGVVDEVISGTTPLNNGSAAFSTSVGNTQTGSGGIKVGVVTHGVAAFIRALDDVTDTTVIANPKMLVLNRQKADLLVGGKQGYLSSTSTDTATTQTVEFLEIGTQLTLRPFISQDDFVRLELRPSVSDGSVSVLGGSVIPNTTNQELTTNVVVRNGQTVVMGGLFKEDMTVQRNQVPGLGDIPILGTLFKGRDDTVNRDEVIFLITPTIIKDERKLSRIGEVTSDTIEQIRLGAREGLLPWSRTKMISSHLREAQRFYEEGDFQKALWATNLALAIEPMAPEALKMKERITSQAPYQPANLSVLQQAVNQIIDTEVDSRRGMDSDLPIDREMLKPSGQGPAPLDAVFPDPVEFIAPQPHVGADDDIDTLGYDEIEDTFVPQNEAAQSLDDQDMTFDVEEVEDAGGDLDVWNWAKSVLDTEPSLDSATDEFSDLAEDVRPVNALPAMDDDQLLPAFEDDEEELPEWFDSADQFFQQTIEVEPVDEVQPQITDPDADRFGGAEEPEPDNFQFDDDAAFIPAIDEHWPVAEDIEDPVEEAFEEDTEAFLPAIEDEVVEVEQDLESASEVFEEDISGGSTFADDWSDLDEDFDPGYDELDDDAAFIPAVDPSELYSEDLDFDAEDWNEDAEVMSIMDEPWDSTLDDLEEDGGREPQQLEFIEDQVGSTDPFNAVVEWLLTPDQNQGAE